MFHCVLCTNDIPEERSRKKAVTCSPECQVEYRRQRRAQRGEKKCRLCGRAIRQRQLSEAVLMGHTTIYIPVGHA